MVSFVVADSRSHRGVSAATIWSSFLPAPTTGKLGDMFGLRSRRVEDGVRSCVDRADRDPKRGSLNPRQREAGSSEVRHFWKPINFSHGAMVYGVFWNTAPREWRRNSLLKRERGNRVKFTSLSSHIDYL